MDARYEPAKFEEAMYQLWLDQGVGRPRSGGARFTLIMPPANVTGNLHMGHALTYPTQDALVRFHRLLGEEVLYLPGTDHAGIATQLVVEREVKKEGLTRAGLGRDAFLERVWRWREHSGGQILGQLRRLGVLADWDRLAFTLDPGPSLAVRTFFRRAYHKGLIYRGAYIVNWCPRCRTALSDLEVVHREDKGFLWRIAYPLTDGEGAVTVATTRPETMLGDAAVAVHPDDARYQALAGRTVHLPLSDREIPVVMDQAVEVDFGTGAVKVTPAHDPGDFDIASRHHLSGFTVIDEDGRMTAVPAPYLGLSAQEARQLVVDQLRQSGALVGEEPYLHAVGHCERCDTVIEPRLSLQWFLAMKPLAELAIRAMAEGEVTLHPERFTKVANHWLESIHDWCISRQLWWGHQIPAWHCLSCQAVTVPEDEQVPARCEHCGSGELRQDPDVLDTWFSSALWPFSTLGWPAKTADLAAYFPSSTLVTGSDILFFWVIRMLVASLELTGQVPFRQVMLHGLVRDSAGRKMSKTLGNGIDPLLMIDRHGADALRWSLLTGSTLGQDVRASEARVIEGRNFANKIWNAARFLSQHGLPLVPGPTPARRIDLWLKDCLAEVAASAHDLMMAYEMGAAAQLIQDLFWERLCDVYLEVAKARLTTAEGGPVRQLAGEVLAACLVMLHPFVPFVTEAVWQALPETTGLVASARWPAGQERHLQARAEMDQLLALVRAIRNLKAEAGLAKSKSVEVRLHPHAGWAGLVGEEAGLVAHLAGCQLLVATPGEPVWERALSARSEVADAYLRMGAGADQELERLDRDLAELAAELARVEGRLGSPAFRERAPKSVVAKEEARLAELRSRQQRAEARRQLLAGPR